METKRRIALLIDADNAQATLLPQILEAVKKQGTVTIRRIYGDWTTPQLGSWREATNTYALQPIQQFRYTAGKNSTDSALIIDAMDIIYTAGVDGICIVSSDSDYTRLAHRIREKNLFAIGVGRKTTPDAFVNACDLFICTDDLPVGTNTGKKTSVAVPKKTAQPASETKKKKAAETVATVTETKKKKTADVSTDATKPATEPKQKKAAIPTPLKTLLQKAFESAAKEDGWVHLGTMGSSLQQLDSKFDSRTYGHKLLSDLVEAFPDFIEVKRKNKAVYIRLKGDSKSAK